jgi:thioredoxin-like negative regulator of GroEL
MKAAYLSDKFATALTYENYLQTGTDEQRRRWKQVYDAAALIEPQKQLVRGFTRQMKLLIVSGIWCGDCVQQCPLIARIAQENPGAIDLRLVDRDQHRDLSEMVRINAGDRVPVVLFLAEDFEFCAAYGERTISRYRALVRRHLDPACDTGIVAPEASELAATLAEWLVEIERVQLMLRFSPRLRQKHGD